MGLLVLSIPFELLCILTWIWAKEMNSEARLAPAHGGACFECYPGINCKVLTNGNVKGGPFSPLDCIPPFLSANCFPVWSMGRGV